MLRAFEMDKLITVWRSGAVGDFVLTLPALTALKKFGQGSSIRVVAQSATSPLFEADISINSNSNDLAPLYSPDPLPHPFFNQSSLLLVYGKPEGPLFEKARMHLGDQALFWDPMPPQKSKDHITDHLLKPLENLIDLHEVDRRPTIRLKPSELVEARESHPIPTVLVHPGSSSPIKSWPLKKFVQWARQLSKEGIDVGFIRGPVERERGVELPNDLFSFSPPNLRTLAATLAQTQLFVGNDSGPGHIAAAVGTATLSLFGPTDPTIWSPRRETSRCLVAPQGNLQELSVEHVLEATMHVLASTRQLRCRVSRPYF